MLQYQPSRSSAGGGRTEHSGGRGMVEEKGKTADRRNRRNGEKNKLDKQVWQGDIRQM